MSDTCDSAVIAGAGPTGSLLALFLARSGVRVTLYESRADPRVAQRDSGRSINLALADRGVAALERAGLLDRIRPLIIPMRGRYVHHEDGSGGLQPYGRRPNEVIYSISRRALNEVLLQAADDERGVELRFEHQLTDLDWQTRRAIFRDARTGQHVTTPLRPLIAADGAGSRARQRMSADGWIESTEADLEHGYKELSIPAGRVGAGLAREALHIWPRGGYMLIALPNLDGSFTATLFLPMRGAVSFESLDSPRAIDQLLSASFPDARSLMPNCIEEFERNPTGHLGTVYARSWHVEGEALLIGDAAHAIVPFHGQGMNCCFEDCVVLDEILEDAPDWQTAFARFYARRKPDTDAIAEMALENYLEMRAHVADPAFVLQRSLALELEARHPQRFVPRYAMVMFHHEIAYRIALERGRTQQEILTELTRDAASLSQIDYARAAACIEARLPELATLSSVRKL